MKEEVESLVLQDKTLTSPHHSLLGVEYMTLPVAKPMVMGESWAFLGNDDPAGKYIAAAQAGVGEEDVARESRTVRKGLLPKRSQKDGSASSQNTSKLRHTSRRTSAAAGPVQVTENAGFTEDFTEVIPSIVPRCLATLIAENVDASHPLIQASTRSRRAVSSQTWSGVGKPARYIF